LRLYNPDAEIIALIDEKTKQGLAGKRSGYERLVSEIKSVNAPGRYSQKEASRWIKTSIHHYVSGGFLFIDCDTIIAKKLEYDFPADIKIGAVLDTHVTLERHHLREYFQNEDKSAGFSSSLNTNKRYNGGVIFCGGCPPALDFFEKWHSLWVESAKKGCSQDMPSLNQAIYETGNSITELNGGWNCQISHNGLPYLHSAKIIHYYATSLSSFSHPYLLASAAVFKSIKDCGEITPEIMSLLENPLGAFERNVRIISDKHGLEVIDSSLFNKLVWLRYNHSGIYKKLNSFVTFLAEFAKKIFNVKKARLKDNS